MLAQQGTLERSALGPKPEVILPFYQGSRSPSPETAGQTLAEENHIVFIGSEKPDLLLPDYRRYETHEPSASDRQGSTQVQLHNPGRQDMSRKSGKDRAAKLDWSANIDNASPRYEVIGSKPDIILPMFGYQSPLYKSPVPSRLDWSANIESQAPAKVSHRIQSPESKVMNWNANIESASPGPPAYEEEYNMLPSPAIVAQNAPLLENAPLLKKTWTPKQDAELMLDMQQDEVISRIHSISAREKTRKRRSVTQSFKLKMFNRKPSRKQAPSRAEVISYVPNKTEPNENIKKLRGNVNRRSVRDEIASNMMSAYREQHRAKAKEIEFSFPMEIVPPLAKQFIDETKLVRTETGELAYELDEEEGYLLRNCDKHKYLRRSQTDPRPLDLLGSPERTEFGSVIRRSGTVCLPTSNQQLSELELQGLTDLMGYKKLCRIEKQYTTQSVNIIDRKLSLVEQLKQLPKEECMIPTPPPSTPTPTPPPSPEEEDYTPIQYQYVVPTVQTRVASAEDSTRPVSRKYTEVLTPPAVTPIPEVEEDVKEEEMLLETLPDTPSPMSLRAFTRVKRSESTGSLDSYCGKFVDDILLHLSFEKQKSKSPTLVEEKNLTYTIADEKNLTYTIERSYSTSSGRSVCVKLVDEVFHLSTLEKEPSPTPLPSISSRNVEKRSYSRSSGKDLCIKIVDEAFILSTVEKEKPISDKTPCLSPDELEHVPIAVSRSSSGVSIYCDNFVDKLLLRISLEKDETPPLTPDEMEVAPIAESFSRSSSGLSSYCGKVVDDILLHISVEKESVSPVPTEKYPVEEFGPIYTPVCSQSFCSSSRSITSSSSSSSSRSSNISGFCDKLVDDLLIRIRVEKVKSVSPPPSEKDSSPVERLPTPVETARQHSSRSLDSYCGRYVDDMLVRITVEKSPSPTEGDQTPSPSSSSRSSTLSTPTASHRSSSSRSLDSFCGKFVDKLLLRISVDKVPNQRSLSSSSGKSFCVNLMDGVVFQSTAEKETNPSSPADLSSVRSPVKEESSSSSSPSAGDPSTPYLPHTPAPTPTETTAQLASSRSYSRSSGKSYCVKLVDEVFHLSTVEAAKSITPIPIEREQTPYYAASPSPSVKEPTPAPAEPTPSPLKEPTPSPTEPTPSPITIEKDLVPPIEKQYVIRESDRDDTATTSFVSGIAHSICLQDQFVKGAESDSESCASYTRTPEIWKLTPLPPVQSARSPTPSVKSVGEKSPSEGTSPPPSTVVVSAPASPREATVVMSSNSPSEQQEPSDSSYVSASRDAIASPASDGALSDDEYQAYAESAYSDDFASDDEVQKSKTSSPSPLLASSPSPLFFNRTPTVVRTPEEEEEESKSPAPSPLFIKRSPPVIRTPTEEEAKRERMDREKTAPAGLEREVRVWQPLPPPSPSPSRLSVGTPARHSAGSLKPLSLNKLKAGMNQWRIPPKSSNRYLRRRVKIELDPESPYIIHHVDKQIAVQLAQDEMDSTRNEDRLHDFMKYKRKFNKMSQKKRIEELSEQEVRKTEITNSVYLGGKTNMNNRLLPLPSPPRSPPSSDSAPSPDEKEGFDSEKDAGLLKILDQIRNLTNASIGEMKTYNAPPLDVHAVVKCVYTILGENPRRLDHWQECVVLLSKLGRKHVRKRVLRMRKDRVTPEMREEVKKLLAGWTSYDIAQRSRVCVLFFIWCKEICDLNESPEDNPLLPIVMGRFMNKRNNNSVMSKIFSQNLGSGRNSTNPEILPGEESRRMVIAAARAFRMNRAKRRNNVLPSVSHTPSASRTPA